MSGFVVLDGFKLYIFNQGIEGIEDVFFIFIREGGNIVKAFEHGGTAIKRKSIDLGNWKKTIINPDVSFTYTLRDNEETVVLLNYNEENWTLITTQRILGKIDNIQREVEFADLDDVIFGHFKSTKTETTIFRTIDIYGEKKDFLMETGKPSIAYIYGIETIESVYKTSA